MDKPSEAAYTAADSPAGPDGGHIVAAGTPEDVARAADSVTGPWLAEHLGLPEARQPDVLARSSP
ncbi:MAG TPA: hypothetical protein VEH31_06135 [Streptosporangiaceae bacterium]|nr:hypothetical protein [Streptosporangiaceae bacterium]